MRVSLCPGIPSRAHQGQVAAQRPWSRCWRAGGSGGRAPNTGSWQQISLTWPSLSPWMFPAEGVSLTFPWVRVTKQLREISFSLPSNGALAPLGQPARTGWVSEPFCRVFCSPSPSSRSCAQTHLPPHSADGSDCSARLFKWS